MNNPTALYIAIFGWAFVLILSNRTLRRSEVSRLKDRLIDKLEACMEWLESEIHSDSFDESLAETQLAGKVTLIEFKIKQLNRYTGTDLLSVSPLSKIRDLDVTSADKTTLIMDANEVISDIIEAFEVRYSTYYFDTPLAKRLWMAHRQTLFGALIGLGVVLAYFASIKFLF